ncbi:AVB_G0025960.mRNA.1.CDS.1 [Saccharomyces cerevisiae]|nr:AVB_G0025960.mRNA.1.CDS.1 [Saccharomyces cerevisiae]CAI7086957.1 AVB_G0025960.mRNA.1.CDS.1 [Saccharomyces cerevisiae]
MYKFIHDQRFRHGLIRQTSRDTPKLFVCHGSLEQEWSTRGTTAHLSHNAKACIKIPGEMYDANPASVAVPRSLQRKQSDIFVGLQALLINWSFGRPKYDHISWAVLTQWNAGAIKQKPAHGATLGGWGAPWGSRQGVPKDEVLLESRRKITLVIGVFINSNERFVITLENCAYTIQGWQTDADATIALKRKHSKL